MNCDKCVCIRFSRYASEVAPPGPSPYSINNVLISFVQKHSDLGVVVESSLKFHQHILRTAGSCNGIITNLLVSTLCRDPEFMMSIYKSYVRPKLECGCNLWNMGYMEDTRKLERVQRRWTREVFGLTDLSYSERLSRLNLFSVQGRLLRADLIMTWKIFNGKCALSPDALFTMETSGRRGHSLKIYLPSTNVDFRRRFFAVRVIPHWNALAPDTVTANSIETFKAKLHRDLAHKLYDFI